MKRRILVVDDEVAILLTLKAILEMNGFAVDTAESAKEAIDQMKAKEYNMVITDMRMETESAGYDVIKAARKMKYNPATAILTAFPTLGNDWQSRGVDQLLVKPVGTEELLRQLEVLLIRHEDDKQAKKKSKSAPVIEKAERSATALKPAV